MTNTKSNPNRTSRRRNADTPKNVPAPLIGLLTGLGLGVSVFVGAIAYKALVAMIEAMPPIAKLVFSPVGLAVGALVAIATAVVVAIDRLKEKSFEAGMKAGRRPGMRREELLARKRAALGTRRRIPR